MRSRLKGQLLQVLSILLLNNPSRRQLLLFIVSAVVCPRIAAAAIVTTPTESALRTAISDGTVQFACDGTIVLQNPIIIATETLIDATGHKIIISGQNQCRVFYVATNQQLTLSNLSVAYGRADRGAGIFNDGGDLTLRNCVFMGNNATCGSDYRNSGTPGTNTFGGAIYNAGSALITDTLFTNNSCVGGTGATGATGNGSNYHNAGFPGGSGGAGQGGALYNLGALSLTQSTLVANAACGGRGGDGGYGGLGGLGTGYGGPAGNGGDGLGAGLYNCGSASIVNTTFCLNSCGGGHGGTGGDGRYAFDAMYGGDGGNGGNGGLGSGGAINDASGRTSLTNCTVAFNTANAGAAGGGGHGANAPYGNGAEGLPGMTGTATFGGIAPVTGCFLINSLLATNTPGSGSSVIADGGHNLSSDSSCAFHSTGSRNSIDPLLGSLADNGGPTPTIPLFLGSPAIDTADVSSAPATDQRGFARPFAAGPDIGAFEATPPFIIESPHDRTLGAEGRVDLYVRAGGLLPISYQWFFNSTNFLPGATNSLLCLSDIQPFQAGIYSVLVTNNYGAVTSSFARVEVVHPVVTTADESSLRAALPYGGHIVLACDGAINLANPLSIESDTILDATGHQLTLSGSNSVRILEVKTNITLTLLKLDLADGTAVDGGAIFNNGGVVNLLGSTMQSNVATALLSSSEPHGGAIYSSSGAVNATNCLFLRNAAIGQVGETAWGGAVCAMAGQLTFQNCLFVSNMVYAPIDTNNATTAGSGSGGAIYTQGQLLADMCLFQQNAAVGADGFVGGTSGGSGLGGAICNNGSALLERSLLISNRAVGGVGADGPYVYIPWNFGSPPGGQGGHGRGGALFNGGISGETRIANCTMFGDTGSGGQGGRGGINGWAPVGGPAGIGGDAVGGICDSNGQVFITNCTIANCVGTGGAGNLNGGFSGTFSAAGSAVGGLLGSGTGLLNTLLSSNYPSNCSGRISDAGNNLSSDTTPAFQNRTSITNVDPRLGPLADNGGPTLTMALLPGSPAIDAGASWATPPTDQRGFPRPIGPTTDIGAFEYGSPALLSASLSSSGMVDILAYSSPGRPCVLLRSADFSTWTPIGTNLLNSSGTAAFTAPVVNTTHYFYRLQLP